jgi:hypothetical protein
MGSLTALTDFAPESLLRHLLQLLRLLLYAAILPAA